MYKRPRARQGNRFSNRHGSFLSRRRTRLAVEALEARQLLACTVCDFDDGLLTVNTPGGGHDDIIRIGVLQDGGDTFVAVTFDPEGAPPATTEKVEIGPGEFLVPGDVEGIEVMTHGGRDQIDVR